MRLIWLSTFLPWLIVARADDMVPEKSICHGSVCYPAVFEPTQNFSIIHEDQSIPAGLRVRINMETGLKEGRLMRPEDYDDEPSSNKAYSDVALIPGEEAKDSAIEEAVDVKPYPPSRPLHGSDVSTFTEALSVLASSQTCDAALTEALDTLEELAHELEFGLRMIDPRKSDGLRHLTSTLGSEDASCRLKGALVLGSALRNNENALSALPDASSLPTQLLSTLAGERDETAQKMLIYALSAVMPHKSAGREYVKSDGHAVLSGIYDASSVEVQGKIADFVQDHFAGLASAPSMRWQATEDETDMLRDTELDRWCRRFQDSLTSQKIPEEYLREKMLTAIDAIRTTDTAHCHADPAFLEYLVTESSSAAGKSHESLMELARNLRPRFGNIKASRKHGADYL